MMKQTECSLRQPRPALLLIAGQIVCLMNWNRWASALLLIFLMIWLSGCASSEPRPPSQIREPVPRIWTDPLPAPGLNGTFGEYIGQCELVVRQCNDDRASVRDWSNSKPTPLSE